MTVTTEVLRIVVDAVSGTFHTTIKGINRSIRTLNTNFISFGRIARQNKLAIQSMFAGVTESTKEARNEVRGFRGDLLGILFFGMALRQMGAGLLGPAAQAFGIGELFDTAKLVTFLPLMEKAMPLLLDLLDWVLSWDKDTQTLAGGIALSIYAIGSALQAFGIASLGLAAFKEFFKITSGTAAAKNISLLGGIGKSISGIFIGLTAAATAVLAVLAVAAIGIWLAWEDNFMNIKEFVNGIFSGLKMTFKGTIDFWTSVFSGFVAFLKGDVDGVKQSWSDAWDAMKLFYEGVITTIGNTFATLGIGMIKVADGIKNTIKGLLSFAIDKGAEIGKKLAEKIFNSLPKWLQNMVTGVGDIILNLSGIDPGSDDLHKKYTRHPSTKTQNDFLMRPGQSPVSFSPNDNIIGFKGNGGGIGGGVNITQNLTISGSLSNEVERMIKDNNKRLVDDIRRMTGA